MLNINLFGICSKESVSDFVVRHEKIYFHLDISENLSNDEGEAPEIFRKHFIVPHTCFKDFYFRPTLFSPILWGFPNNNTIKTWHWEEYTLEAIFLLITNSKHQARERSIQQKKPSIMNRDSPLFPAAPYSLWKPLLISLFYLFCFPLFP